MIKWLTPLLAVSLTGCASTIMRGYIGEPIQAAMVDYGAPTNAFDMDDGRRAFQWVRTSSYTAPTQVSNRGVASASGNSVWWTQNSTITGGQTTTSDCLYTLYGRWNGSAWIVDSFEEPRFLCE